MKLHQWTLSQAYDYVKSRRPHISPNLHFMGQLLVFQKQLESERSARDVQCAVSSFKSFYTSRSFARVQVRSSSAPSVFITDSSQALDSKNSRPQIFETCKEAVNKGLNNLSPTKFPITPWSVCILTFMLVVWNLFSCVPNVNSNQNKWRLWKTAEAILRLSWENRDMIRYV